VEDDPHNLSSRSNVAMGARGRLCYNVWLLNHEMRYFWRSPIPFIKAAAMLPVVNRYAGRSLREFWRELDTWSARLLVLAMYPLAIALTLFHSLRIAQGTARAGEGTS
jgi:hypothetical protein